MNEIQKFNLFRVNCLLNDSKSANFNSIILSIIHESFYENKNKPQELKELYYYIKEYLKILVEFDFLEHLIVKSGDFTIDTLHNDSLIQIKPFKFSEIEQTISSNSLEKHVSSFLTNASINFSYKESIENLLYAAVFENINSFSVENLKSILPDITAEEFTKEEIEVFNAFLDYDDPEKNKAIYNVLSRAVEFAILTSGKGIKEINKEIFADKSFILDTNIIFRLLGIGGEERLDSVMNLLEKCKSLGIRFEYTGKTHLELNNKLEQIINFLNSARVQENVQILGEISESNPELVNDDFIIHYSIMKRKGIVHTPEQYQRKLYTDYQRLLKELGINLCTDNKIDEKDLGRLAKFLFAKKKEMKVGYGRKASEVDAYNLLLVKRKRHSNDHNFSDVKCFYLTSDRSLNFVVSHENNSKIPETILPSQLYILCKPYFDSNSQDDYNEFIKFIKKRKTGFKYGGSQVLNYIKSIRELTTDVSVINESLTMYADLRFKTAKENLYTTESHIPNYKTVLKTLLDQKLEKADEANKVFESLKNQTKEFANAKFSRAKNIARTVDGVITISVIPICLYISKQFTQEAWIQILSILLGESFKFYLSSRFKFFNSFNKYLYNLFTKGRRHSLIGIHQELVALIDEKEIESTKNIWS